jgi:hypothetical protein
MANGTKRLSIDLAPIVFAALELRAESDGQTKAAILRSALRKELAEEIRHVTSGRQALASASSEKQHPKLSGCG